MEWTEFIWLRIEGKWRVVVNTAMKLWVFIKRVIYWLAEELLHYQERLFCVELEVFYFHGATAPSGPGPPHHRGFTITLRLTTLGRTPLYEWPARRRDLYLITHNTHKRETSVPPAAFEPTIPASERPLTHAFRPRGHWDRRSWKLVLLNASYFTGIFSRWITYCFVLLNGVSVACVTYHRALNSSKICKLLFLFKHHVVRCIRSTGDLIPSEWNVFDRVLTHSSADSCCDRY